MTVQPTGEIHDIVTELVKVLGRKITAYVSGAASSSAVAGWLEGVAPDRTGTQRLRAAYDTVCFLREHNQAPATIKAWFRGPEPLLKDRPPALALREDDPATLSRELRNAAMRFIWG